MSLFKSMGALEILSYQHFIDFKVMGSLLSVPGVWRMLCMHIYVYMCVHMHTSVYELRVGRGIGFHV